VQGASRDIRQQLNLFGGPNDHIGNYNKEQDYNNEGISLGAKGMEG
jgi:hypothetical protein